jgi:hypothetical protein
MLHSEGGFAWYGPTLDMSGGSGGYISSNTTMYRSAGNGGRGGVFITAPTDPASEIPSFNMAGFTTVYYGNGTLGSAQYPQLDTLVSLWQDTTSLAPTYTVPAGGWMDVVGGSPKMYLQGAHAAADGTRDPATESVWMDVSGGMAGLTGYRFWRFKLFMSLDTGPPAVDTVWVDYTYNQ